jgi:hypothetical protein
MKSRVPGHPPDLDSDGATSISKEEAIAGRIELLQSMTQTVIR